MLQKLNERIQGVVAWLVVVLIAVTFTIFGVDYYMQTHQNSNVKVLVNNHPITNQAFETNYRRTRSQIDMSQMSTTDEKNLQNKVLDQMIANEVTVQAARQLGFEVSTNQANSAILSIPQFQEDGHFSPQRYQQALSGALFTPESFQKEVRQGMLLNQQRFAFIGSSFALPAEVKRFVRLYMQTRDYDYLTVSANRFESQVKVNPEEIKEYYDKHKSQFMTPEQVSVEYVQLSMHDIRDGIKISDEDIKRFYEENKSNYLTPAQWQVAHILFAIPEDATQEQIDVIKAKADKAYTELKANPNLFDQMVTTLSDDKLSVADKGVLPWISAAQAEYAKVLVDLNQPGQISSPQQTKHGIELFKLIAYKPVQTKTLTELESTIKNQLLAEQAQTQYSQALEKLSDLTYQTPDSLSAAADALKLKIQTSELFSRNGGTQPLTQNKQLINTAFNHDILELGNNSDPIQLDNDSVVVIRIKDHKASKQQSLAEVENQIHKFLSKQMAEVKAKHIGTQLLNPVEDKQQKELMSSNQLVWHTVTQASRDNDKNDPTFNDLAFNLLRPDSRDGTSLPNGDFVVVKLKQINDGKLNALDKEQRDSLIQQIEASYGMMDYDLYVNSLIKHAQLERH